MNMLTLSLPGFNSNQFYQGGEANSSPLFFQSPDCQIWSDLHKTFSTWCYWSPKLIITIFGNTCTANKFVHASFSTFNIFSKNSDRKNGFYFFSLFRAALFFTNIQWQEKESTGVKVKVLVINPHNCQNGQLPLSKYGDYYFCCVST